MLINNCYNGNYFRSTHFKIARSRRGIITEKNMGHKQNMRAKFIKIISERFNPNGRMNTGSQATKAERRRKVRIVTH